MGTGEASKAKRKVAVWLLFDVFLLGGRSNFMKC